MRPGSLLSLAVVLVACGGGAPVSTASPVPSAVPSSAPATAVPASTPVASPDLLALEGRLLFARYEVEIGDTAIWVADGDGSGARRLVSGAHYLSCVMQSTVVMAGPSAAGRLVISVADLDGSPYGAVDVRNAHLNLGIGACSPDGAIVYAEGWLDDEAGAAGIFAVDIFRGTAKRITKAPAGQHDIPGCVTGDGRRIAFIRADVDGEPGLLHTVDVQGGRVSQVSAQAFTTGPACAPDGSAFLVEVDSGLYLVGAADGRATEITSAAPAFAAHKYGPEFAGDDVILFSLLSPGPFHDIYAMRFDGTGLTRLTRSPEVDNESPRWVRDP